ncbi:MAG: type II secretion system protein [Rickettsiales bacterium]|jgi:prepilin-type N-terminal cleavage/methylation domain-containing protein|nr:type II secretion system protein [Rickettsiales bacterium]
MFAYKFRQAFSLLELSLVIIIISLLVAGATSGLKIVRKAQIQSSIKKIFSYKYAFHEFVATYQAIPGDFSSAHSYFDDSSDSICGAQADCNGDGDGILELNEKSNSEIYRAWQHLSLANFVDTKFFGEWNEKDSIAKSPLNEGNISFDYDSSLYNNILKLGSYISYKGAYSDGGIFTTKEAKAIDVKYDDGDSNTGKIIGYNSFYLNDAEVVESDYCVDGPAYKTYNNTDNACNIGFLLDK